MRLRLHKIFALSGVSSTHFFFPHIILSYLVDLGDLTQLQLPVGMKDLNLEGCVKLTGKEHMQLIQV